MFQFLLAAFFKNITYYVLNWNWYDIGGSFFDACDKSSFKALITDSLHQNSCLVNQITTFHTWGH